MTVLVAGRRRSARVEASQVNSAFDPSETHGIYNRPNCTLHASSAALGWRNLFVFTLTEPPWKATYGSVSHHFLTVQRNGPVRLSVKVGGRSATKRVAAGDCTLCPGGEGFTVEIANTVDNAHIYLRDEMIEQVVTERGVRTTASLKLEPFFGLHEPLIEQLAFACVAALEAPSPSNSLYIDHLAWALAAHLVEVSAKGWGSRFLGRPRGLTDRQLRRVEEYMHNLLDRAIIVDDLAAAAGLSPVYFARQFKLRTGSTPHRYLRSMRIARAKQQLLDDRMPIVDIALSCGFCNQEHMTKVFRLECGTTPAAFRRARAK
jgi:AraC family transcriptional regulator